MTIDIERIKQEVRDFFPAMNTIERVFVELVIDYLADRGYLGGVWRPIESAPKDGTWVMGYWKTMPITQYPCICFADRCFSNPNAFETVQSNEYGSEEVYPTHWMPLPPPPQKGEKK
jgi:hypothetical protein